MKKRISIFVLGFILHFNIAAQQITFVEVVSFGIAQSEEDAISKALVRAISQVNGEAIASNTKLVKQSNDSAKIGGNGNKLSSFSSNSTFLKEIDSKTKGVVKSWRVLGTESINSSEIKVRIAAQIYVVQKSAQTSRLKIALIKDPNVSGDLVEGVLENLSIDLVKSRKFAVIDKKNTEVIENQLNEIRKGQGGIESQVRLGNEMTPDLLAVISMGAISKEAKNIRVAVNLQVIDYSTRQIKFAEKKFIKLGLADTTTSSTSRINLVSGFLYRALIYAVFPPLVVGTDGQFLTIAQGSDYFKVGDKLILKKLGEELRDPHTKEFLSYDQIDVGEATVTYSDPRITRAKISKIIIENFNSEAVLSANFQVFRVGQSIEDLIGTKPNDSNTSKKNKESIFLTDDDDD